MKAKFNKSTILKSAWKMVKDYAMDISSAMKKAWSYAKKKAEMVYLNVSRETEKAVAIDAYYSNGVLTTSFKYYGRKTLVWFPKSMMVDGCIAKWMFDKKMREY